MEELEKEFPLISRINKDPKTLLLNIPIKIEKILRSTIFISTVVLMFYVIYQGVFFYTQTPDTSQSLFSTGMKDVLKVWKAYRNVFYLFMVMDIPLMIIASIILGFRKKIISIVAIWIKWFLLLYFITFSYALAGLVADLVHIFLLINQKITK
jgi:hypothetical protein